MLGTSRTPAARGSDSRITIRSRLVAVALFASGTLLGCGGETLAPVETSDVFGEIRADGLGLADVAVSITSSRRTVTDADGGYEFRNVNPGRVVVRIEGLPENVHCPNPSFGFNLRPGELVEVDFQCSVVPD